MLSKRKENRLWIYMGICQLIGDKHNSLYDAKVIKELYERINK